MAEFWDKRQRLIMGGAAVILAFLLWEALLTWVFELNTFYMSKPSLVFIGWWEVIVSGQLWSDILISAQPLAFGFGAAIVVGVAFGVVMGWRARVGYALDPFFT